MSNGTVRESKAIDRIRDTIPREFVHLYRVDIRMNNGEIACPDIAIWREEPCEEHDTVTTMPVAVIDVDSRENYADPEFYFSGGIVDYVVFNPLTNEIRIYESATDYTSYVSPMELDLNCGCVIIV